MIKNIFLIVINIVVALFPTHLLFSLIVRPSNNREWSTDLSLLPYAEFNGRNVTIHNIRNFRYQSVLEYTPSYYDKTFDLDSITSVDFIVEPFSGAAAHTFLAFGFADDSFVDVSVEVRREKGEFFNAFKGLFRKFELIYVIANEEDVLKLRTNYRKDSVYLYPIKTTKEKMALLFTDMLMRANALGEKPEFYNSITNTCTTNIVDHVNRITPKRVPLSWKYFLPKYSDELALELGLINDSGTIEEIRARHNVTEKAQRVGDSENFSALIRK